MSKRVTEKKTDQRQGKKASGKGNVFQRIGRFFAGLGKELKKVTWPDRLKLRRTSAVTFAIILTVIILIAVTDFVLRSLLNVAGFNDQNPAPIQNTPVAESTTSSSANVSEPSVSVESPSESASGN